MSELTLKQRAERAIRNDHKGNKLKDRIEGEIEDAVAQRDREWAEQIAGRPLEDTYHDNVLLSGPEGIKEYLEESTNLKVEAETERCTREVEDDLLEEAKIDFEQSAYFSPYSAILALEGIIAARRKK